MASSRIYNSSGIHSALLLTALGALLPASAFAQDKAPARTPESTAAVWDIENLSRSTLPDETVGALTQYIRAKVFNIMPNYRWLNRGNITEILDEQKFQASGCTDQSCVVELGQLLGARKMVTGSLSKTGAAYNLTLSLIDIETGLIDNSVSEVCLECTEGQLYQLAEKAVLSLSWKSSKRTYEPDPTGLRVHKKRSNLALIYPGAGLRYFFSDKTAVEARGQYLTSGTNNHFSSTVLGMRLYRYLSSSSRTLNPYLCLEGNYIVFNGDSSKGRGAAAGAYGGIEYFLSRSLSIQTDLGVAYITIKDNDTSITESGADYILNFSVNIYLL